MQQHLCKRNQLSEDQPNINHLDISSRWKALGNTDEERSENKERSKVDCNNCLKEEVLKEVCGVDDDEDENGWQVDCQNGIVDSSFEYDFDMNPF